MSAGWGPEPLAAEGTAPAAPRLNAVRPLAFAVRREVWENRSLYLAPLTIAVLAILGYALTGLSRLPRRVGAFPTMGLEQQRLALVTPFSHVASAILFTGFVVGVFYCLDALHGERRDRSILFWKSLPVSDRTTVLAKALIPLAVLPLLGYAIATATQVVMLAMSAFALAVTGAGAGVLFSHLHLGQMPLVMLYGLLVHTLWYAPLHAYLLLVSAWARRSPMLWAVLPPLGLALLEHAVLRSSLLARFLGWRLGGAMRTAFAPQVPMRDDVVIDRLSQLDPLRFLSTPGLYTGLVAAAVFLALAVRVRRYREPL